ncbi:MAG: cystathionine beta-synthase [SAR324 cluster bacterium]|nr:cystathionine beta-synthase [SAR324 cluster bacterium]
MLYQNVLEAVGNTPLVRLNRINEGLKPLIAAKLEYTNPGGSVKDRIALAMVEEAERKGELKPGGTIIEGTSGNTGMGLALVGAVKGYNCIFTMPDKMSKEKIDTLRGMGAEVVVTPTAVAHNDPRSYHAVAARLNREIPNSIFPNQYNNPQNPLAHFKSTGPEIWEQTEGKVTHVVIGVGTGGTITGVGRFLKQKNPDIKIVGVDPEGSIFTELFKTGKTPETWPYKVEGVGQDELPDNVDFSVIDDMILVGDKESFTVTRQLAVMEGMFAGGSSGLAVAAALRLGKRCKKSDYIVVLLPDSGERYLSKIFNDAWMKENQYLDPPVKVNTAQILSEKGERGGLISVSSDATIGEAIDLMRAHGISQLPVIADGDILGGLDEAHLLELLLRNSEAWHHNVLEFMDDPFPEVSEDAPVEDLVTLLGQKAQALLVRQRKGGLSIITKSDLIFTLLKAEKEVRPYNT